MKSCSLLMVLILSQACVAGDYFVGLIARNSSIGEEVPNHGFLGDGMLYDLTVTHDEGMANGIFEMHEEFFVTTLPNGESLCWVPIIGPVLHPVTGDPDWTGELPEHLDPAATPNGHSRVGGVFQQECEWTFADGAGDSEELVFVGGQAVADGVIAAWPCRPKMNPEGLKPILTSCVDVEGDQKKHQIVLAGDIGSTNGGAQPDGEVTFQDFLILSNNFGEDEFGWQKGDMDYDGEVDFADFLTLSANFGRSVFGDF